MNDQYCPACGGTILRRPYRAVDGSKWCETCYTKARKEVTDHYALEERVGLVDLHEAVLGVLDREAERIP